MGIYSNQYAVSFVQTRDGKNIGTSRVAGLPLMTLAQARKAVELGNKQGKGQFVVINTKAE